MIAVLSLATFLFPGALESGSFLSFGDEGVRVYGFELRSSIENAPLVLNHLSEFCIHTKILCIAKYCHHVTIHP